MSRRAWITAVLAASVLAASVLVATAQPVLAEDSPDRAETESPEVGTSDPGPYRPYRPPPQKRARAEKPRTSTATSLRDTAAHHRPVALNVLAYVPWIYGIGIGGSLAVEIPVLHDGFIRSINDAFSIEPSFAFAYLEYYGGTPDDHAFLFRPAVAGKWSFYLLERLRGYVLLNFGYSRVNRYWDDDAGVSFKTGENYFYGEPGAGVEWSFAEHAALRAEIAPHGLRSGLSFLF